VKWDAIRKGRYVLPDPLNPILPVADDDETARLALARALFEEFHARCFWHSPRSLEITLELIPFVAQGLRANGGRVGFDLAARLHPPSPDRETEPCR
jgi:hypothetical protein